MVYKEQSPAALFAAGDVPSSGPLFDMTHIT